MIQRFENLGKPMQEVTRGESVQPIIGQSSYPAEKIPTRGTPVLPRVGGNVGEMRTSNEDVSAIDSRVDATDPLQEAREQGLVQERALRRSGDQEGLRRLLGERVDDAFQNSTISPYDPVTDTFKFYLDSQIDSDYLTRPHDEKVVKPYQPPEPAQAIVHDPMNFLQLMELGVEKLGGSSPGVQAHIEKQFAHELEHYVYAKQVGLAPELRIHFVYDPERDERAFYPFTYVSGETTVGGILGTIEAPEELSKGDMIALDIKEE